MKLFLDILLSTSAKEAKWEAIEFLWVYFCLSQLCCVWYSPLYSVLSCFAFEQKKEFEYFMIEWLTVFLLCALNYLYERETWLDSFASIRLRFVLPTERTKPFPRLIALIIKFLHATCLKNFKLSFWSSLFGNSLTTLKCTYCNNEFCGKTASTCRNKWSAPTVDLFNLLDSWDSSEGCRCVSLNNLNLKQLNMFCRRYYLSCDEADRLLQRARLPEGVLVRWKEWTNHVESRVKKAFTQIRYFPLD